MEDPLPIGPFDLGARLGEGGMGAGYRGQHRPTGVPVAIKVLRQEAAGPEARDRFHREVQAHAALQHPGIVYLFDYGDLGPEAADAARDELRAGDPFVVMDLGGSAWRVKLADFGIAHALQEEREADTAQLESWIHRAMAIDPEQRFRRAADAVWALPRGVLTEDSPDTRSGERRSPDEEHRDRETTVAREAESDSETHVQTLASTVLLEGDREVGLVETVEAGQEDVETPAAAATPDRLPTPGHPPLPEDWRPEETEKLPAPLVGAGLGLFGLREPPFVDRTGECRRIWESLREVVEHQTSRLVTVRGDAGTGKTRLVEWLATRAHEVGAVQVLRAVHTPADGPNEGLRGALEQNLRTLKMDRSEVFRHLSETLPPLEDKGGEWRQRDARALTEYLRPTDDQADEVDGPRYRFTNAEQKRGLVVRILRRLATHRPMFLWLDDLRWGDASIGVVRELLDSGERPPALLIAATVRSDILRERPDLADEIEALEASDSATRLPLTPLEADHQRELLQGLLPLDDELAASDVAAKLASLDAASC